MSSVRTPRHVAFILDGNRRWAKGNGLPSLEGHRKGYETLKNVAQAAFDSGVEYVSAFCFSTENWNRSKEEVNYLLKLAHTVIARDAKKLAQDNIRIIILGVNDGIPDELAQAGREVMLESQNNTGGTLVICFNYGGQREVVDAVKAIIKKQIPVEQITAQTITNNLYDPTIPPIDLLIRTGGEKRLSNYMLWQSVYAELYFVDKYWPEFSSADLHKALVEFNKRNRRFGGN